MKIDVSRKRPAVMLLGLLAVWGAAVALLAVFLIDLYRTTDDEVDRYMLEISSGMAATINSRMDAAFNILESIGVSYLQFSPQKDVAREYLRQKAEIHQFIRISFTGTDGHTVFSDGRTKELSGMPIIARAFEGKRIFTRSHASPVDGTDGILYARPVYKDGKIAGVITAWCDLEHIKSVLRTSIFGGEGYAHIVDLNGSILLSVTNKHTPRNMTNYFDVLYEKGAVRHGSAAAMREHMLFGETGHIDYTLGDGLDRSVYYMPLKAEGLSLLSVIPSTVAWDKFNGLLVHSLVIMGAVLVLFTLLVLAVYFQNRRHTEKLARIAFVDPVTGGMSRARFELEVMPRIAASPPGTYALVALNINQFKLVNDVFGTEAGNLLLKRLHSFISDHLAEGEFIFRDSADEFILFVRVLEKEEVLRIIGSFTGQVNDYLRETQSRYVLRVSVGVYEIEDTSLPLVRLIDRANMARKSAGAMIRSDFYDCVFYRDIERRRMIRTKDIENRMDDALANEDFIIYLQPKIELEHRRVCGAEALVRWLDPQNGLIPPSDFIPCFESNGFIIKLDLYVFECVCRLIRGWIDRGLTPVLVSVNLSRAHLVDPAFPEKYAAIRDQYGLPHGVLEIELTESLVFENFETLVNVVNKLHEKGFKCSLDDFGCGYSSLNLLKKIKVDTLKLDGAFWESPNADDQSEKDIITSVVELARKLGMTTVSEGVETATQVEFLRRIQCDMVQGYVFSKPVPPDVFEEIAFGKSVGGDAGETAAAGIAE